jgi:hypothetical protein
VSEETGEMEGKMRQKERKKTMGGLKNPDDRRWQTTDDHARLPSLAFLRFVAHTDRRKDELLWRTPTTTTDDDARLPSLAFHRSVAHNERERHTHRELLNYQASARTRTTLPGIVAQTHLLLLT